MKSIDRKKVRLTVCVILTALALTVSQQGETFAKKAAADSQKQVPQKVNNTVVQQTPGADAGGSVPAFEDLGVDLVVSKVVIQRGTFHDGKTIKVTPYIKNMCNGRYSGRIKILLSGLDTAEWIETGIGSKAEKSGGALYFHENESGGLDTFSVEVDNNNEIEENNDSNNTCPDIQFRASDMGKTHRCTIRGAVCPDAPAPGRDRIIETLPR